jgi:pimeloyl-ACP methyl ester carboxylesterase
MSPLIEQSTISINRIKLRNGVELQFAEQGESGGIPVVFLHGYTDSWHSFEPVLPYLPASIHAFALTQRGHGDSDRPANGYTPSDMSGDVAEFIGALGLGSAVIAGHSMGSTNAQKLGIDYPDLVRGLILMGSFIDFPGNPLIIEFASEIESLTDEVIPEFAQGFQESTLAREIPAYYLELVVSESAKLSADQWKAVFRGLLSESIRPGDLMSVKAPSLVMWGDQDAYAGREAQDKIVGAMPNATLTVYEGLGHALHWEDPARIAADIVAFVKALS